MIDRWLDTLDDDSARRRAAEFWASMREDIDTGEFWADRIKRYRDQPEMRLGFALSHLPLPAAIREAVVAVRALVRAKRKAGESWEEELTLLYWLAAIRSFILEYAPRLQRPGFGVIEAIPGDRLRSLRYDYSQLGYRELSLLNKTDVKWLIAAWGEPESHTTLNVMHRELWDEYETKLIEQKERARKESWDELLAASRESPEEEPKRAGLGCSVVLVVILSGAVAVVALLGG